MLILMFEQLLEEDWRAFLLEGTPVNGYPLVYIIRISIFYSIYKLNYKYI